MEKALTEADREKLEVIRRLLDEGFSAGNLDVCDELVASDCIEHQRGNPHGSEGHKKVIATLRSWFDDFRIEIEDYAVDGDVVWVRNRATGTNTGAIMGFPATGTTMEITVFDSVRLRNGKIVEHWGVPDQLGLLMQLGHLAAGRP